MKSFDEWFQAQGSAQEVEELDIFEIWDYDPGYKVLIQKPELNLIECEGCGRSGLTNDPYPESAPFHFCGGSPRCLP